MNCKTRTKEATEELIRSLNILGGEEEMAEGMYEALANSHRTLQQTFFRVLTMAMKDYAEVGTDLRNAAAINYAKKMNEIDFHFPLI
jgi:hypothetical protein